MTFQKKSTSLEMIYYILPRNTFVFQHSLIKNIINIYRYKPNAYNEKKINKKIMRTVFTTYNF